MATRLYDYWRKYQPTTTFLIGLLVPLTVKNTITLLFQHKSGRPSFCDPDTKLQYYFESAESKSWINFYLARSKNWVNFCSAKPKEVIVGLKCDDKKIFMGYPHDMTPVMELLHPFKPTREGIKYKLNFPHPDYSR